MDKGLEQTELMSLAATYSILTADRILDRFGIRLQQDLLLKVVENPQSVYFAILLVPYTNVINGIIHQQAYDYQVYAQKLFVDYLVSGSGNENSESQGADARDNMEKCRIKLTELSESFDKETVAHKQLILETQSFLIQLIKKIMPLEDTEELAQSVRQAMLPYHERATAMGNVLGNLRIDFKMLILDTIKLIQLLPNYKTDEVRDEKNRESLQFDDHLGVHTVD